MGVHEEFFHANQEKNKDEKPKDAMMEKMLETRSVLLTGQVNKEMAERVARQLILMEAMGDKPVKLYIDSQGGDADSGFAILDMIRFVKPNVYTIGMGLVASAGALILLSSPIEHRIALPNSHYLIHQPLSGIRGVASEIEIYAKEIDKMKKKINKLISEETGQKLNKVEKDTDRDYWMSAEEAKKYGLVSKVVSSHTALEFE
ncbi:MAG TPA: ATP-dependent Clp protease proteolytic subunit [bacterium]|nr:ATP-dependent Clp protease proteolytic subunit [bacterium]